MDVLCLHPELVTRAPPPHRNDAYSYTYSLVNSISSEPICPHTWISRVRSRLIIALLIMFRTDFQLISSNHAAVCYTHRYFFF